MASGAASIKNSRSGMYSDQRNLLLLPSWVVLGFFVFAPVCVMLVYSFLTKEFRGGVIWEPTFAAYDQFFFDRGLFGDAEPKLQWTYISIFWRSIWQAGLATILALIIGFPTAYFIATRPPAARAIWVFLITVPYWVNLLIRTVSMKFLVREEGPLNDFLIYAGIIEERFKLLIPTSRYSLACSTVIYHSWCYQYMHLSRDIISSCPKLRLIYTPLSGQLLHASFYHPLSRVWSLVVYLFCSEPWSIPSPDLLGGARIS